VEICCWYPAIELLFETGFRRGELLGLKWADLKDGYVILQQAYVALNGKGMESDFKTESSYRSIPIQSSTNDELKKWKEHQRQIKIRNKKTYKDHGYIFTDNTGKPIDTNWFTKKIKKLQNKLGIQELSPPLRSTHCGD